MIGPAHQFSPDGSPKKRSTSPPSPPSRKHQEYPVFLNHRLLKPSERHSASEKREMSPPEESKGLVSIPKKDIQMMGGDAYRVFDLAKENDL